VDGQLKVPNPNGTEAVAEEAGGDGDGTGSEE
jgi:hypothetical protein